MEIFTIFLRKCCIIVVFQERIKSSQEFLRQLNNLLPQSSNIKSLSFQLLPNNLQTSLIPRTISIITRLKIRMILVNTIVGEMNIRILQILLSWCLVILNTKSSQSFLIQIANIWTNRRDKYIQPQIEFSLIQKQRFIDVRLNYPLLSPNLRYIRYLFDQTYSIPLSTNRWFGNEHSSIFYLLL